MKEINGSFFDEEMMYGIVPDKENKDVYIAVFQNGAKAAFKASAEEIREAFCPESGEKGE